MRARRLRRLGVATAIQSPMIDVQSNNETPPKSSDLTLDAQKNKISSLTTYGSIEIDDNEHKQKQIKYDEDIDVRQKKDTIFNNNEEPTREHFIEI